MDIVTRRSGPQSLQAQDPECPICRYREVVAKSTTVVPHGRIYTCSRCSGFFLYPTRGRVEYVESDWTSHRLRRWESDCELGVCFARAILADVGRRLKRPVQSVLEVGCGSGFMARGFEYEGCAYTGVDIDSELVAFARTQGLQVHCVASESLTESPLADRQFDLVLSSNTLEHVVDPQKTLANMGQLSGGLIAVVVPNPDGLLPRMKSNRYMLKLMETALGYEMHSAYTIDGTWHNVAYSAATLKYLCQRTNLRISELKAIGVNDGVYGFVQPNSSVGYRLVSGFAAVLRMDCQLLLIAVPQAAQTPGEMA